MMKHTAAAVFVAVLLTAGCPTGFAADNGRMESIETGRGSIRYAAWWIPAENARRTVVLLPGGAGGFGYDAEQNQPRSTNFLVRSREYFVRAGCNILIAGKPDDVADLSFSYRITPEHVADIRRVVMQARELGGNLPVWLVGNSRGTISATAAAIAYPDQVDGLVLTAGVVNRGKSGSIQSQAIARLRMPVLVVHHRHDACPECSPADVRYVMSGLSNAVARKLILLDGSDGATGPPCEALHHHGFIGIEAETVAIITDWMSNPAN